MRRFSLVAFLTLIVATLAAFFITQHLKVTTPLITGVTGPIPAAINPVSGITCSGPVSHQNGGHRSTEIAFYLLHQSDAVDVYVIDANGDRVATLASNRFMSRSKKVPVPFVCDGRAQDESVAPAGRYYFQVHLIHQNRTVTISNQSGPLPVTLTTRAACP